MSDIDKDRVVAVLNRLLEAELAGVVRYTHYSFLVFGFARIPIVSWLREQANAYRLRSASISQIETDAVAQDVWFESWEKGLDLCEMARHYHRSDTTVALLWFADEDLPEIEHTRFGTRLIADGGLSELTGDLPWPGSKKRR